ncbi:MAG: hypothetical protein QGH60_11600 [Phycisphaerae bacterium]|jgi:hypothetical protein|nr:hypothetical protein [Phycisphaerae bacterium]
MSKCDIVVEFDKADRAFHAGEIISGKVYVTPNADMPCNGILIEIGWSTHGRGNKDSASIDALEYDGKQFLAGQTIAYEFRFESPSGPLTYHGHYLNVDNYLSVRLDVPWSFDPKAREEYLLLPGPACAPVGEVYSVTETGEPAKAIGCALIVVGAIAVVSLFFGFLPVIIVAWILVAFLGFKVFRNSMASRQLGEAVLCLSRHRAAPGEQLPISVEFSPTRPIGINGITATIKGVEEVVSGSGTNRSTHTKTIYQEHFALSDAAQLSVGRQAVSGDIPIPQTDAWTFYSDDNKLTWEVTLRVDIPNWPDWVASAELELIPSGNDPIDLPEIPTGESAQPPPIPIAAAPAEPTAQTPPPIQSAPIQPPLPVPPAPAPPPEPAAPDEPAVPDEPTAPDEPAASDGPAYASDLEAIVSADRFGSERDDLIARAAERTYDLAVTIKSASWTLESSLPLEYRNGRTVVAGVEDTDTAEIAINFPEDANNEIDALSVGTTLRLTVRPREFNKFYDRMEALAEKR